MLWKLAVLGKKGRSIENDVVIVLRHKVALFVCLFCNETTLDKPSIKSIYYGSSCKNKKVFPKYPHLGPFLETCRYPSFLPRLNWSIFKKLHLEMQRYILCFHLESWKHYLSLPDWYIQWQKQTTPSGFVCELQDFQLSWCFSRCVVVKTARRCSSMVWMEPKSSSSGRLFLSPLSPSHWTCTVSYILPQWLGVVLCFCSLRFLAAHRWEWKQQQVLQDWF